MYLERYQENDCEAVCKELMELGDAVRSEAYLGEATAVAEEFVHRSIHNLRLIHSRLQELGFAFEAPEKALVLHDPPNYDPVRAFEAEMGTMPMLFEEWYARIESLAFVQSEHQEQHASDGLQGLGWRATLVMEDLGLAQAQWEELKVLDAKLRACCIELGYDFLKDHKEVYGKFLKPSLYAKYPLPSFAFDTKNTILGQSLPLHACIRNAFSCGGFKILVDYDVQRDGSPSWTSRYSRRPDIERIRPMLTEGLLPV